MITQELLYQRREALRVSLRSALGAMQPHSVAFVARVLGSRAVQELRPDVELIDLSISLEGGHYQGYPWLAAVGFAIGTSETSNNVLAQRFRESLARLLLRTGDGHKALAGDDLALLGIAEGLSHIADTPGGDRALGDARIWLLKLVNETPGAGVWSSRMRDLAGDLLDQRGRLRVLLGQRDEQAYALELVLRTIWPHPFHRVQPLEQDARAALALMLLTRREIPDEAEEAAVWLRGLDILVNEASLSLVPTVSDTVRLLQHVQSALKRWVWRDKSRRRVQPSRWLIDDEYDVQSLLWTVLYPIYGSALVDEEYLPSFGNVQPRVDLGITSLKTIIEVKIARELSDFNKIEEQVAGDLGLYFKDTTQFDRMIVFIYDDCDKHHPEKYEILRHALKQRERIEEVIIVRRPGMLPDRDSRA